MHDLARVGEAVVDADDRIEHDEREYGEQQVRARSGNEDDRALPKRQGAVLLAILGFEQGVLGGRVVHNCGRSGDVGVCRSDRAGRPRGRSSADRGRMRACRFGNAADGRRNAVRRNRRSSTEARLAELPDP